MALACCCVVFFTRVDPPRLLRNSIPRGYARVTSLTKGLGFLNLLNWSRTNVGVASNTEYGV